MALCEGSHYPQCGDLLISAIVLIHCCHHKLVDREVPTVWHENVIRSNDIFIRSLSLDHLEEEFMDFNVIQSQFSALCHGIDGNI